MALSILHRDPGADPIPAGAATWRTCLREVQFTADEGDRDTPAPCGRSLLEGDAYRLLLEILCGLRSPMLGETQVLGQFKAFLSTLDANHAWLQRLGQRLLTDAREIRTHHLQGLGSRSYGSAVRRYVTGCRRAALIGTGKLANEVLPFLDDDGRVVDHWGRREDAASAGAGVTYRTLDRAGDAPIVSDPAVLIVAAPAPDDVIAAVAARYSSLTRIIDLRGEPGDAPLSLAAPVVTLQDLFAEMRTANDVATRHVDAARSEIARRSRLYELREELRPFGWDDLCA